MGDTKFIRVNGRIVPLKGKEAKGPSDSKRKKNYNKHGDGANQAAKIDYKYEKRANKGTTKGGLAALAGVGGVVLFKSNKLKALSALAVVGGFVHANMTVRKNVKRDEVAREKEYVKTFGTTSDGSKPSKNRTGLGG